jgi:uncharacterized protein YjiS (DUF1127 family)
MSSHDVIRAQARQVPQLLFALRGLADGFVRFRAARRASRHLQGMDDRILRDIGVSRWELGARLRDDRF